MQAMLKLAERLQYPEDAIRQRAEAQRIVRDFRYDSRMQEREEELIRYFELWRKLDYRERRVNLTVRQLHDKVGTKLVDCAVDAGRERGEGEKRLPAGSS